jgi:protein gp37
VADRTAIEWADASWNPIRAEGGGWACVKLSPACAFCYSERLNLLRGNGRPYLPGRHAPPRLDDRVLEQPLRWRRPRFVFVCSMTDIAWERVPDAWVAQLWAVMALATRHTFLVLTKRPDRLAALTAWEAGAPLLERVAALLRADPLPPWPLPNVWVGATVENQTMAGRRVPHLLRVPAAARFLSCEPLLGPLDLSRWLAAPAPAPAAAAGGAPPGASRPAAGQRPASGPALHWVITGGESGGPAARRLVERCARCRPAPGHGPASPRRGGPDCPDCPDCRGTGWRLKPSAAGWLRSLRDQCRSAGVAYFHKQHGGPTPKAAGCTLDGVVWHQYPDGSGAARQAKEVA